MLLSKGLIRIGMAIPATAPSSSSSRSTIRTAYASASELSLFRRPLATTNLRFLSTVMWDGRETFKDAASTDCTFGTTTCFAPLHVDLADPVERRDPAARARRRRR